MRWVVHGAGAVGGVIGGHLHLAGLPTTLVARGAHLAAIRDGGLRLDTGDGMHRIVAPATDTAAEVEWTDDTVVLLAVKSHQAAAALDDLAAHAPAGTPVVCATNGVATELAALRRFAATYAVCVMLPVHPPRARTGGREVPPRARASSTWAASRTGPTSARRRSPPTCARPASSRSSATT